MGGESPESLQAHSYTHPLNGNHKVTPTVGKLAFTNIYRVLMYNCLHCVCKAHVGPVTIKDDCPKWAAYVVSCFGNGASPASYPIQKCHVTMADRLVLACHITLSILPMGPILIVYHRTWKFFRNSRIMVVFISNDTD